MDAWLTPARRAELRRIRVTRVLPAAEQAYLAALAAHRTERQEADARRT